MSLNKLSLLRKTLWIRVSQVEELCYYNSVQKFATLIPDKCLKILSS